MSLKEVTAPVKDLHDRYYAKTPIFWAKVGDSLLLVSTSITAYSISAHADLIAYISLGTGLIGKIILNFAKE